MKKKYFIATAMMFVSSGIYAQNDSILNEQNLDEVVVKAKQKLKLDYRTENVDFIDRGQMFRAACCNLGESFSANPSVDVSYSDPATGAQQIKLLGLNGTYVQMMTENMPNLRGASIPYSLSFVPGLWMQSISVSKGAASVKNGYESITGQINIEYLKPQGTDGIQANAYLNSDLMYELDVIGSTHINDKLSTSLMAHFNDFQQDHDENGDGFMEMPKERQWNVMHRWAYVSEGWISQLSMRVLKDERESGMSHHHNTNTSVPHYGIFINNNRYEAQWKNGFTIDAEKNTSIALMLNGSWHDNDNAFGNRTYEVTQKNGYAQLMFESDITPHHNIATGASVNHDYYIESLDKNQSYCYIKDNVTRETTPGVYAQYTYKWKEKLTAMAGLRYDHSSLWGGFVTPRLHVKYTPFSILTLRASAGKGYRTAHALAENSPMLASARELQFDYEGDNLGAYREEAWNYGVSANLKIPVCGKDLDINADYYYTDFLKQMVMNYYNLHEVASVRRLLVFDTLHGPSYSHTIQVDATYPFFEGFTATGAFRYNDARTTYNGILRMRPLTSKYKGLLTMSYKTPMELWQFDVTGQLNGPGELYNHSSYPAYFQLQAQITREFRHFSVYVGGENLTDYVIPNPIINAHDPWSGSFDATQVWGPADGRMIYAGIRFKLEKL